ncbi:condensation domain protein [Streptomyces albus]|uniref:Condensation domain protein n=1 Tax=Streptomyces albus (strain ATCC 21838 / DSM 41398 / FERM P-419 / JCM 4703 / NBRC 107858) TaxID=1081613 RepID=A0A0B5F711_STRA4|nr:condensation domain protein [Streptomyces albus]AOU81642.1 condensation domain protein [Streptomyces albus]AYN37333.1 hypothetical protein DUI70_6840 [Streptomyces albus]
MEFTELGACPLPPGDLSFWTPRAATAAWRDDRRTPPLAHARHVHGAAAAGRSLVDPAWVGLAFRLGPVAPSAVGAALTAWLRAHEHLRSRLVPGERERTRLVLPARALSLQRGYIGRFADPSAMRRQIEACFDRATRPLDWPQVAFATVESAEGVLVLLAADHGVVDGTTLAMTGGEVRGLLAHPAPAARGPGYIDFGVYERRLVETAVRPALDPGRWHDLLAAGGGAPPGFPLPLGPSAAAPQQSLYRWLLDAPAAARFAAAARAAGGSTAAGLLACLALAARATAGTPVLRTVTLTDARPTPWRDATGWFVGLHPVAVPVPPEAGFPAVVAAAAAELRDRAPGPGSSAAHLTELLGREVPLRFVVSCLDVRRVPGTPPRPEDRMLRSRVHAPQEVYLWFTRSERGVHLSARFPGNPTARASLGRFIKSTARLAARIADHGTTGAALATV